MAATESKKVNSENPAAAKTGGKVWFYSLLLTLQYGAQPLISKRFVRREVIVTSSVLTCEAVKVICALVLMAKEGTLKKIYREWTLFGSLTASGLPAAIYALQNSLLQISYKNLDSLTFSILNQTKLFFTALFTYIILRQKQSIQQIGALFLLIMAAVLLSVGEGSSKASSSSNPDEILFYGIVPVLVASVLSGLASALCQWASQVKKHSSYLMTVEMSIIGSLCLISSTSKSPDGEAIRQHGFFYGWTALTLIPVILNAVGGILVGLVTSYAGGVRKGFVIVSAVDSFHRFLREILQVKMPTLTKLFTMEEASEHNTKDDCWVVIDGKVYDVSSYLDEHPGGDDVLLGVTGQDATDEFEDAGHSKSARELMEKFFIGELDTTSSSIPELEIVKKAGKDIPQKLMEVTKQYWFVPVAAVGISVVLGFLYTRKK